MEHLLWMPRGLCRYHCHVTGNERAHVHCRPLPAVVLCHLCPDDCSSLPCRDCSSGLSWYTCGAVQHFLLRGMCHRRELMLMMRSCSSDKAACRGRSSPPHPCMLATSIWETGDSLTGEFLYGYKWCVQAFCAALSNSSQNHHDG
jgi:hypothetical protein